tara:strand:- start:63 stop:230 length:168 start_codon:yes stop_codon:yes gene_type:complete
MRKTTIAILKKERADRLRKKQQQLESEGGKVWKIHTEKEIENHELNKENDNGQRN